MLIVHHYNGDGDSVGVVFVHSYLAKHAIYFGMILFYGLTALAGIIHLRAYSSAFWACACPSKGDKSTESCGIVAVAVLFNLYYTLPLCLVTDGEGAVFRFAGLVLSVVLDGFLEFCLRRKNTANKSHSLLYTKQQWRVAVRLFLLGFFVLARHFASMHEVAQVDYEGPMRVTKVTTLMESYTPSCRKMKGKIIKNHYPVLTLEWGHEWACPLHEQKWCKSSVSFFDDPCYKKIYCSDIHQWGFSEDPACSYKTIAEREVQTCVLAKQDKSMVPSKKVDRGATPWKDPQNPYTMTFAGNCDTCEIYPKMMTNKNRAEDKTKLCFGLGLLLIATILIATISP